MGVLGFSSEVVLVCLSIIGLWLECVGLRIVYVRFWHVLFMVPSRWRTERIEDDSRPENKSDFCALRSYETVFRTRRASQGLLDIACPVIGRELL